MDPGLPLTHDHLCPIIALAYLLNDGGVEWLLRMGDYLTHLPALKKFLLSAYCGLITPPLPQGRRLMVRVNCQFYSTCEGSLNEGLFTLD